MVKVLSGKKAMDINWVYIIITVLFLLSVIFFISTLGGEGSSFGEAFNDLIRSWFG